MIDQFGRNIHKLRIQLLDQCQFRCMYCMPESRKFTESSDVITKEEIFQITKNLVSFGIDEVRLTGGEPLLRKDLIQIAHSLSTLSLTKIGLTTNGYLLHKFLEELQNTKVNHLNISLDSLDEKKFFFITKSNFFQTVYQNIIRAKELGFLVKINIVMMRGVNDDEIESFIQFANDYKLNIRFLELMNIGVGKNIFKDCFMNADEIESRIRQIQKIIPIETPRDNTSYDFKLEGGGIVGFIASETKEFCQSCSRLRLSAKGDLRPCLFKNEGINLRGKNLVETGEILQKVIMKKPYFRIEELNQPMYAIGG